MEKKKTKAIETKFNKRFYPLDIIKKAIEDYKSAADITLEEDTEFIKVKITPKEEVNNIKGEFCNYVLALFMDKYKVE